MEPRARYLVVGTFVVGLITLAAIILIWLSASQWKVHQPYVTYMTEAANGLSEQAPVKFMGVDVGYVEQIRIDSSNPKLVQLLLYIEKGTPIDSSTTATLMVQGITGVTYIGLKAGEQNAPALTLKPGQRYPVIPWRSSYLVQLDTLIREVGFSLKKVANRLDQLLGPENQLAIRNTLRNLDHVTGTLSRNSGAIQSGIRNISGTFKGSEDVVETLKRQTIPEMSDILRKMMNTLKDVQDIAKTLKSNPSVLIRGQAPGPAGPGE